jgi:hypothetical protein
MKTLRPAPLPAVAFALKAIYSEPGQILGLKIITFCSNTITDILSLLKLLCFVVLTYLGTVKDCILC